LTISAGTAAFVVLAALLGIEGLWERPLNHAHHPKLNVGMPRPDYGKGRDPVGGNDLGGRGGVRAERLWPRMVGAAALLVLGGAISLPFTQIAAAVTFGVGLIALAAAVIVPHLAVYRLLLSSL
jgi:hypothetical protein